MTAAAKPATKATFETILATLAPEQLHMCRLELRAGIATLSDQIITTQIRIKHLEAALLQCEARIRTAGQKEGG